MFDCGNQMMGNGEMMGMMGGGMMGGGMLFGTLLMLAVLVLIVLGIWALVVWLRRDNAARGSSGVGAHRAREILEERYARGELSTEEYRERLQGING